MTAGRGGSSASRWALRILIAATYSLAAALIVGETYRSWGVGRPLWTVADDYVGAALLAWAA
jgi:hypothetical protein